ncbi:hypothetical protein [Micromonospora tulbaghiae]|uniref:hypothetical protein n=1 Tax=Micromonospora tulbaghiae TaxID=479978 RepID=UPI0030846281
MAVCSSPAGIPRSMRQPSTEVRADKRRKAGDGFDGSGVAHPGLVATCREEFHVLLGDRRTSSTGRHRRHRWTAVQHRRRAGLRRRLAWAPARWRWGTSWRTPPPPRSPAARSGSGLTTPRPWPTTAP